MQKDFDRWNKNKKTLNNTPNAVIAHPRELWWCALGANVGAETDGKNKDFERPVLIIKVYNKDTLLILPSTSKVKDDPFHYEISNFKERVWIKLTQVRVISHLRLLRKIGTISIEDFEKIKMAFLYSIWNVKN